MTNIICLTQFHPQATSSLFGYSFIAPCVFNHICLSYRLCTAGWAYWSYSTANETLGVGQWLILVTGLKAVGFFYLPKVISTLNSGTIYQKYVTFSATLKVKTDAPDRNIWLGWLCFYICVSVLPTPNAQATCREGLLLIVEQSKDVVMIAVRGY